LLIADVHLLFHPALAVAVDAESRLPPLSQTVDRPVQTDRQPISANDLASPNVFTAADPALAWDSTCRSSFCVAHTSLPFARYAARGVTSCHS
jgi:hypothetical protein